MSDISILINSPEASPHSTLIFAHGAGAGMEHAFMEDAAKRIAANGTKVIRFEFPYMQRRRDEGKKFPPNRLPVLLEAFHAVIKQVPIEGKLLIGGKSMGGRVASLIAAEHAKTLGIEGLIVLGYPFFAARKERIAQNNRGDHLANIELPTLIVQGDRDTFGGEAEVKQLPLSPTVKTVFVADGDHSFKPRVKSGFTLDQNMATMAETITKFQQACVL